ncbi:uncharacterized protein LOC119684810 [Teleopsis dalmanni]|nr:uncharacterized protein LOC119684810 [Teleopsis dalmanni]
MWSPGSQRNVYYAKSNTPKWKHFSQNYRERREIYEQLLTVGKIFNFDMKACIKRAMCEVNTYLKPYGVSLMEDIVRILLTVPSSVNDGNEYNFKTVNCVQKFAISCPYRVLEILTGNMRPYKTT